MAGAPGTGLSANQAHRIGGDSARSGIVSIGTARSSQGVPKMVSARQFSLVDTSGVIKAAMVLDGHGDPAIMLSAGRSAPNISLMASRDNVGLDFYSAEKKQPVLSIMALQDGPCIVLSDAGSKVDLSTVDGKPAVDLSDSQGYEMALGATGTIMPATDRTQQTSASSMVMFGNDKQHHVIWQVPR